MIAWTCNAYCYRKRMFTRRLRAINPKGDLLERTRRQLNGTAPELLEVLERCLHIDVRPDDDLYARTEVVVEKVRLISETHASVKDSLDRISKYEEQLARLIRHDSLDFDVVGVFRSSYCMLEKAEIQVKELIEEANISRGTLEAKCEEIRHLRSRLTKAENTRISERVESMRAHLTDVDEKLHGARRRASETLITAFEESERTRVMFENEVIKLRCALEAAQKNFKDQEPVTNQHVYKELAHVQQVNRELLRHITNRSVQVDECPVDLPQTSKRPGISFESISDSFRRELETESHEPNYSVR
jgi:hypothetical protein